MTKEGINTTVTLDQHTLLNQLNKQTNKCDRAKTTENIRGVNNLVLSPVQSARLFYNFYLLLLLLLLLLLF